ncbi:hypothetical protein IJG12_00525 [Candidatus Saccharibacteria bacterium]|nr:hypothetical protein [Candidatus Saccharibacteria bacterium]
MSKFFSLLKASMSEGMNVFRVYGKKQSKLVRISLPIVLAIIIMVSVAGYADMMMEPLAEVGMEFVVLTLYIIMAALFILVEGIYKASGLLFNCRDDDLMLSLPVKKSTVLTIRVLKFYLFEVMINAIVFIPAMVVYAMRVGVGPSFYLVSLTALLILPILPIVIASLVGGIIAFSSAQFKHKNIAQIILTTLLLLVLLFVSINIKDILQTLAQNAKSVNEIITKLYYPAGQYIHLVLDFKFVDYLIFILTNVGLFTLMLLTLGSVYYKINSRVKIVKTDTALRSYTLKYNRPLMALFKKEIGRFVSSPVFLINAGFGLVLYVVVVILVCVNMDGTLDMFSKMGAEIPVEAIINYMPACLFGLIFFTSMMTSITSSMISLEGKSFNILKSLPTNPVTIIMAKVLAAVAVMIPILLVGDIVMFVRFDFDIWQILMIVCSSIIMPLVSEVVGIVINLKYPKMNAQDDTEVVKQSMSSMVAVFVGFGSSIMMIYIIYNTFNNGLSASGTVGAGLLFGVAALVLLLIYLWRRGIKDFNSINV